MDDRAEGFKARLERCEQPMDVVRNRLTSRQFDPHAMGPR